MSQPGPPLHNFSHSLAALHPSPPLLNTGPASNLDPQERKHGGHRKRQIRQIRERGAVGKRNVVLRGQEQAGVEDIPLPERVGVQPRAERKKEKGKRRSVSTLGTR